MIGVLRVAEQVEHVELLVALVALERFDDRLGGEPLMHEQRQGGHVEREPLRLARPVQERRAHRLEPLRCGACASSSDLASMISRISASPASRA